MSRLKGVLTKCKDVCQTLRIDLKIPVQVEATNQYPINDIKSMYGNYSFIDVLYVHLVDFCGKFAGKYQSSHGSLQSVNQSSPDAHMICFHKTLIKNWVATHLTVPQTKKNHRDFGCGGRKISQTKPKSPSFATGGMSNFIKASRALVKLEPLQHVFLAHFFLEPDKQLDSNLTRPTGFNFWG